MSARAAVTTTPYGEVDAAALETLQSGYDTTRMLAAVSRLDAVRISLYDPQGLRDDLLRLHSIAHMLVNGAGPAEGKPGQAFAGRLPGAAPAGRRRAGKRFCYKTGTEFVKKDGNG